MEKDFREQVIFDLVLAKEKLVWKTERENTILEKGTDIKNSTKSYIGKEGWIIY